MKAKSRRRVKARERARRPTPRAPAVVGKLVPLRATGPRARPDPGAPDATAEHARPTPQADHEASQQPRQGPRQARRVPRAKRSPRPRCRGRARSTRARPPRRRACYGSSPDKTSSLLPYRLFFRRRINARARPCAHLTPHRPHSSPILSSFTFTCAPRRSILPQICAFILDLS